MTATKQKDKPGTRTTEFWLSLAVVVTATILTITGDIAGDIWVIAVGVQGGAYSLSRGLSKT